MRTLQEDSSMPRLTVPHDVFRQGLGTLKDDIGSNHVVQAIQQNVSNKKLMLRLHSLLTW